MFDYQFPVITHIDQVFEAIKGKEEFFVKHDPLGYSVVNYNCNFPQTFPEVLTVEDAILRECRGLKFNTATGELVARPLSKFFNFLEKSENQAENLDFTKPHVILEKLDGSMAHGMWLGDIDDIDPAALLWCTKMGADTDVANYFYEFVRNKPQYATFTASFIQLGYTAIFEFLSRKNKVVLDHPVDRMVLIAIRHNETGSYTSYRDMKKVAKDNNIEVVQALPGSIANIQKFADGVSEESGNEGYVIRFDTGHQLKLKTREYLSLHRALDSMRFEKDVIRLILDEKLDDLKGVLADDLKKAADTFAEQIYSNIYKVAETVYWETQEAYDNFNGSKKRFAIEVAAKHQYSTFMFKMFDLIDQNGNDMELNDYRNAGFAMVTEFVKNSCQSQTKVNNIRHIIGERTWQDIGNLKEE